MKAPFPSVIILALPALSSGRPDDGSAIHAGQATRYGATGDGNCMFGPSPFTPA